MQIYNPRFKKIRPHTLSKEIRSALSALIKRLRDSGQDFPSLEAMDSLVERDFITLDVPLSPVELILCYTHHNFGKLRGFKTRDMSFDASLYQERCSRFTSVYGLEPPPELMQYDYFLQLLSRWWKGKFDPYDDLNGIYNDIGLLQNLNNENLGISDFPNGKQKHHGLTFLPIYYDEPSYWGAAFDFEKNRLVTLADHGYTHYSFSIGYTLWAKLHGIVNSDEYLFEDPFLEDPFSDDTDEHLISFIQHMEDEIDGYFTNSLYLKLMLPGYLDTNRFEYEPFSARDKARYAYDFYLDRDYLSNKGKDFVVQTTPAFALSRKQYFNDASSEEITGLVQVMNEIASIRFNCGYENIDFSGLESLRKACKQLENSTILTAGIDNWLPELETIIDSPSRGEYADKTAVLSVTGKALVSLRDFAIKEAGNGHAGFAIALGFEAWNANDKETSQFTVDCFSVIDDHHLPSILKNMAIEHNKVRFQ